MSLQPPGSAETTSSLHKPFVPAASNVAELSIRAVVLGIVLCIVFAAANTYLGLDAGMTVSASIPAAVLAMGILRAFARKRRGTILENNIVQTIADSGDAMAGGIIFTVPALLITGMWAEVSFVQTGLICFIGGLLGICFMIPLRRSHIVEDPVSGITIIALLMTSGLLLAFGFTGDKAILAALGVAAVPRQQQWMEVLGAAIPAIVVAPVLTVLHHAYGIGTGAPGALKAPQATPAYVERSDRLGWTGRRDLEGRHGVEPRNSVRVRPDRGRGHHRGASRARDVPGQERASDPRRELRPLVGGGNPRDRRAALHGRPPEDLVPKVRFQMNRNAIPTGVQMASENNVFEDVAIGICVVDLAAGEIFRNQCCADYCHHDGETCAKVQQCPFASVPMTGLGADYNFLHGVEIEGKFVDLAVFRVDGRDYRFLFPLEAKIAGVTRAIKPHGLTQRELEVAAMMVAGLTNAVIGDKLGITRNTLKSHLKSIYRKVPPEGHGLFGQREPQAG